MLKYSGDFPIAVHPGDILQEMLEERGIAQSYLAKHLKTDVARINVALADIAAESPHAWPSCSAEPFQHLHNSG